MTAKSKSFTLAAQVFDRSCRCHVTNIQLSLEVPWQLIWVAAALRSHQADEAVFCQHCSSVQLHFSCSLNTLHFQGARGTLVERLQRFLLTRFHATNTSCFLKNTSRAQRT